MDVVIIHGTGGSPDGNWFPWAKQELEKRGHNVYVPRMPTPNGQSVQNWCRALDDQAPRFNENTILIGHSCGATYLLHILEVLGTPVKQSIFVSGFIDKLGNKFFDDLNETFVEHEFDWQKIRSNSGIINLLHGSNDPYVPLTAAQRLADGLQTPLTIIENGGHLNAEFGYTEFPEILNILQI
ncbi:alpha/beta hydrolase [Lachnospiraceae bacterium OttesenSCG-928-E19]|nr:alpha/beta hydrolase [Lachnospiraceae bacterium OttesenSCG-928-E19]